MSEAAVQSLQDAAAALAAADSLVAVGHIRPDGDALGAALALALAGRSMGKSAFATFGEPFALPAQFRFLDWSPYRPVKELDTPFDLLVVCDTAVQSRLGTAASLAGRAGRVLVIDHHLSGEAFGDIRYVDPNAAATAELVHRLIRELEWPLTPQVAAALYTGLVTDTGRFQYSLTTPAVHRIAAELLEAGVRPEVVGRHVYEEAPFAYLAVAGAVLSTTQLDAERSFVWSILHLDDLDAAGIGLEDADGLIDLIRIAREAEVSCLLKVHEGVTKGSLRSRGAVDVAAIAARFGGGGHHNASGFTFAGEPDAAVQMILEQLGPPRQPGEVAP